jgi:hypothetical protein
VVRPNSVILDWVRLALSTIPRIWICSINARKKSVKRKTQNVDEISKMCPYLVVLFPKSKITG